MSHIAPVSAVETLRDRTPEARCDEGFLRVRRLVCRNVREDGSRSSDYPIDLVYRQALDAVCVVVWRRRAGSVEVLLRDCLRPAAYFRRDHDPVVPDPREYLALPEVVAGVLEPGDRGEPGIRERAALEVWEEAGYRVAAEAIALLGAPFFAAPGILSEKVWVGAVEVAGEPAERPPGDGTPLEEVVGFEWVELGELVERCERGEVEDAKTEIAAHRLARHLARG